MGLGPHVRSTLSGTWNVHWLSLARSGSTSGLPKPRLHPSAAAGHPCSRILPSTRFSTRYGPSHLAPHLGPAHLRPAQGPTYSRTNQPHPPTPHPRLHLHLHLVHLRLHPHLHEYPTAHHSGRRLDAATSTLCSTSTRRASALTGWYVRGPITNGRPLRHRLSRSLVMR